MTKVTAVFDIGKTNKKLLLFDENFKLVYQHEEKFPTILDEDNFECDDITRIEEWIKTAIEQLVSGKEYDLQAVNFSTYGASLAHIDEAGNLVTPIYNYLKPMPEGVVEPIYARFGGVDEFSRCTSSPALGMLNSGLQILWLKKCKPDVYKQVKHSLHFPQYLSYILTGKVASEHTSIGCHTAMWNFDKMSYHPWLADESITLPTPIPNNTIYSITVAGKKINVGIGIHDSSASLAPYVLGSDKDFILISTGTWCISMNPYNYEPLTSQQLQSDCLCYMSVLGKPVKSSRLFMGHIHEVNVNKIAAYFNVPADHFKKVNMDEFMIEKLKFIRNGQKVFFKNGVPADYLDDSIDYSKFESFEVAYHQFVIDLTALNLDCIKMIIAKNDSTKNIYISGGFARNSIYVQLMASAFPDKQIYTSEIDNSTALGAALVITDKSRINQTKLDLGLREWKAIKVN
jgi:sugar (pentulose or hexulose) kinase